MDQTSNSSGGASVTVKTPLRKSWFLKWILAIGIVVVLNLLINYGVRTFYKPAPEYNDYCKQEQVTTYPDTQTECVNQGGAWSENQMYGDYNGAIKVVPAPLEVSGTQPKGYCDIQFTCRTEFETATKIYNRNVFVVFVILGIVALIASFFVMGTEAVSLGLSLGGVVAIIVGTVRYWSNMDDKVRFAVLLVGFVLLVWLGIKKIRD